MLPDITARRLGRLALELSLSLVSAQGVAGVGKAHVRLVGGEKGQVFISSPRKPPR